MSAKQKIVHGLGPSNVNLVVFVFSFDVCQASQVVLSMFWIDSLVSLNWSMISFILDVYFSWWEILTHLSWSLLEIEQEFNPLNSVDTPSEIIAKLFYASFLFIAVILLVNMLIALLSHTYQRVKVSDVATQPVKTAVILRSPLRLVFCEKATRGWERRRTPVFADQRKHDLSRS